MSAVTWADAADRALARLFVGGQPAPTPGALRAAYPFGERAYHPYKVWLRRVKAWRCAHAAGLSSPNALPRTPGQRRRPDTETASLFGDGAA